MARSADGPQRDIDRLGIVAKAPSIAAAVMLYLVAAWMTIVASDQLESGFFDLMVWVLIVPVFNLSAGYVFARYLVVAIPLLAVVPLAGANWVFGFTGWRDIVIPMAYLAVVSICVLVGAYLAKLRAGERRPPRTALAVAAICLGCVLAAGILELMLAGDPDCEDFEFRAVPRTELNDLRYDGRTTRLFLAENAVRCKVLVGMSATSVRRVLRTSTYRHGDFYDLDLGTTNGGVFFGTIHTLVLTVDRKTGLVNDASLTEFEPDD